MTESRFDKINGGFRDLIDYVREDRPHRWTALALSLTITGLVLYFIADALRPDPVPARQIIYVENWTAERSVYDIRRDWLARAREANRQNQARRNAAGAIGNAIGQTYDQSRADAEFAAAVADIEAMEREVDAAERERRDIRTIQELRDLGLAPPELPPRPATR